MEMIYVCSRLLEIRVSLRVPTRGRHVEFAAASVGNARCTVSRIIWFT